LPKSDLSLKSNLKNKKQKKKKGQTHLPNKQPKSLGTLSLKTQACEPGLVSIIFFACKGVDDIFLKK
jgi:hypothetical protein